ncbi:hypothetical protein D3C87_1888370 [compost metagenome]
MPHITRYGTVKSRFGVSHVEWDNGEIDYNTTGCVYPIDLVLKHPEPVAYLNPIHPSGPRYSGNERIDEWSATFEEFNEKVRELEVELAARPWRR